VNFPLSTYSASRKKNVSARSEIISKKESTGDLPPSNRAVKYSGRISRPDRNATKGWLRAVFDPQMGTALSAIHDSMNTPWTVESLAEAAGMSRSAFAARFKVMLGQTLVEYVTVPVEPHRGRPG
jgi:Bacterial regulatory helix-turn-helix proteins, AraC family